MAEGISIIHDAVEAWCDCDESAALAHLDRLGNGASAVAVAYMLVTLTEVLTDPTEQPAEAPCRARGRLRNCLDAIQNDRAVGTAATIIHDAMHDEGVV